MDDNKVLEEILQRVRRTETRIVRMGDKLGVELRATERIDTRGLLECVYIDSLDVSLSRIVAAVHEDDKWKRYMELHRITAEQEVEIRFGNSDSYTQVGVVYIKPQ